MISNDQQQNRDAWVERLLSGGLKQARGTMVSPSIWTEDTPTEFGYCCLAVAEYGLGHRPEETDPGIYQINGSRSVMTELTAFRLGFLETNPYVWALPSDDDRFRGVGSDRITLSWLNDGFELSLRQIGRVVQCQPSGWTGVDPKKRIDLVPMSLGDYA